MTHHMRTFLALIAVIWAMFGPIASLYAQPSPTKEQADAIVAEATQLYSANRFSEAIERLERALPIYRRLGERGEMLKTLYTLGLAQFARGSRGPASDMLDQALELSRSLGAHEAEAQIRYQLGALADSYGLYANARDHYEQALAIATDLGLNRGRIQTLRALAVSLAADSQTYSKAEINDPSLELTAAAIMDLGHNNPALDQIKAQDQARAVLADDYFQQAIQQAHTLGIPDEEAATLLAWAEWRISTGNFSDPWKDIAAALTIAQANHLPQLTGEALSLRGEIERRTGQPERALATMDEALRILTPIDPGPGLISALERIGNIYGQGGQIVDQLEYLRQARDVAHGRSYRRREADILQLRANSYAALAQYDAALTSLTEAEAIWRELNTPVQVSSTLFNRGMVLGELGRYAESIRAFDEALVLHADIQNDGRFILGRGEALYALGRYAEAKVQFDRGLLLGNYLGDENLIANVGNNLGMILARQGDLAVALRFVEGLLHERRGLSPDTHRRLLLTIAQIQEERGEKAAALAAYLQVIGLDEQLRADALIDDFRVKVADRAADIYTRAIRLSLDLSQQEQAFDLAERARARAFLDTVGSVRIDSRTTGDPALLSREHDLRSLINALEYQVRESQSQPTNERAINHPGQLIDELQQRRAEYEQLLLDLKISNPTYAALRGTQPERLDTLRTRITPDATIVAYYVMSAETIVFVVGAKGLIAVERIPIPEQTLREHLGKFRDAAYSQRLPAAGIPELTAALITPVLHYVKTPNLIIVPHRILHYVPFAALGDPADPLGLHYQLSTLPSANALSFIPHKNPPPNATALVMAYGTAQYGFPALEFANIEASAIANLYGTSAVTGEAATPRALKEQGVAASIIHIVTHAEFNPGQPIYSRLLLANQTAGDGALEVGEIYNYNLPAANLVILSACETGLGDEHQGDDLMSLERAFMYAGAPTVIASLWRVDDPSTRIFMETFHRYLRAGAGKSQALQAAQRYLRSLPGYEHPLYWAAFTLNGDPGVTKPNLVIDPATLPHPQQDAAQPKPDASAQPTSPSNTLPLWAIGITLMVVIALLLATLSRRATRQ